MLNLHDLFHVQFFNLMHYLNAESIYMNRLSKQPELADDLPADDRLLKQFLTSPEQHRRIEQIARRQTIGTQIDWQDAMQAAHLKLLQVVKAGKFRSGDAEGFYHWAVTVARFEIIDLVRHHKRHRCISLDQTLPGTEIALLETIADDFDALAIVERTDLLLRAIQAIVELDQRYPDRGYLKLWHGRVAGKTQTQLAAELNVTHQGTVSKRWKELVQNVAQILDPLGPDAVIKELKTIREAPKQRRSQQQW